MHRGKTIKPRRDNRESQELEEYNSEVDIVFNPTEEIFDTKVVQQKIGFLDYIKGFPKGQKIRLPPTSSANRIINRFNSLSQKKPMSVEEYHRIQELTETPIEELNPEDYSIPEEELLRETSISDLMAERAILDKDIETEDCSGLEMDGEATNASEWAKSAEEAYKGLDFEDHLSDGEASGGFSTSPTRSGKELNDLVVQASDLFSERNLEIETSAFTASNPVDAQVENNDVIKVTTDSSGSALDTPASIIKSSIKERKTNKDPSKVAKKSWFTNKRAKINEMFKEFKSCDSQSSADGELMSDTLNKYKSYEPLVGYVSLKEDLASLHAKQDKMLAIIIDQSHLIKDLQEKLSLLDTNVKNIKHLNSQTQKYVSSNTGAIPKNPKSEMSSGHKSIVPTPLPSYLTSTGPGIRCQKWEEAASILENMPLPQKELDSIESMEEPEVLGPVQTRVIEKKINTISIPCPNKLSGSLLKSLIQKELNRRNVDQRVAMSLGKNIKWEKNPALKDDIEKMFEKHIPGLVINWK
ncbi:MAG: hypothetical protein QKV09_gp2 [Fushun ischnura senegalensis lispivirus 1]|uniref:Uncharacterized protein n=1 Tax=Fushun ischnura senegalensis lispivirus 1 TaxID=2905564 RepID=A0A8K1XGR8_9MONO|nr:MAG: hypothetical protein QKV09_gp2 [Fushun ischnura senegalensis lispivirus 1]UHM27652.1 MAG: hypothetical protein FISLV1_gp2 [Fushun ischnura senegalensis lispivirus 1]